MSDDEYERKKGTSDLSIRKPIPDDDDSDGEGYKRKHVGDIQKSPNEAPGILERSNRFLPPLPLDVSRSKMPGDLQGYESKDVLRPPSEYDRSPIPTFPVINPPEPSKNDERSTMPSSLRTRAIIVNIICYLNMLFLLIYFGATV